VTTFNINDPIGILARTIWAEARSGGAHAMAHVANVVVNRASNASGRDRRGRQLPRTDDADPSSLDAWRGPHAERWLSLVLDHARRRACTPQLQTSAGACEQ
jgi:hypothetical protein